MGFFARIRANGLFLLLFIFGLGIFLYPAVSDLYYRHLFAAEVHDFEAARKALSAAEIAEAVDLARAYNATLDPTRLADPFTRREREGIARYAQMIELHEKIGSVEIPKIGEVLPVYAGTSDAVLEQGVGHMEGTSLPVGGAGTHTVLTAHRGLPKAKLFRHLDRMEKGDVFYIHHIGGVLAYEVDRILTVRPTNFDPIYVRAGKDEATLLTCTPYMINSDRLLVRGHRIPYEAARAKETAPGPRHALGWLLVLALVALAFLLRRPRR